MGRYTYVMISKTHWYAVVVILIFSAACATANEPAATGDAGVPDFPRIPPTEPADAEATFRVLDGFRMELIAAEPLVADPVDLAYDANGRAYVVEFRGYPKPEMPDDPTPTPIGRVRLLEDTDGDGRFDESHVFVDDLQWPTSVVLWKRGIFVAAAPDIWYFEDTNGDNRADIRRKVFTGFGTYNVQAVMNNLRWGLDHWIYGAAAGNGGNVVPAEEADAKPVSLQRRDFRFRPATGAFEPTSGGQRFGNSFDDWGNRFLCNIRNPVQHVVLPSRYLDRNRHLIVPSALHDAATAGDQLPVFRISPPESWRVFRAQRWTRERVNYPRSELVGAGYFTSSSGVTIYRGDAFPPEYRGNAFVADVAANIIHRQIVEPDGVTFTAHRADEGVEFVASTDPWFRPVNFVNAPDGTLTVLDMYRETIEHPWSIPDDIRAKLDLSSGNDRGRLYRLSPPDFEPPQPPGLADAPTDELLNALESRNAWSRETAHRLIFERSDMEDLSPLRNLLHHAELPQTRLHALWSLEGAGGATNADLRAALDDAHPSVREHAVRISETRLAESPKLAASVLDRAGDDSPRVRMQVAFSLGELKTPESIDALGEIARRDAGDEWVRIAILSSVEERPVELLGRLLDQPDFANRVGGTLLVEQLALTAAAIDEEQAVAALGLIRERKTGDDDLTYSIVTGTAEGLLRRRQRIANLPAAQQILTELLDEAASAAGDSRTPVSQRLRAIDLLKHAPFSQAESLLPALLSPQQPQEIRLAAVLLAGAFAEPPASQLLLDAWAGLTPTIRAEAVEVLLRRPAGTALLLEAIEAKKMSAGVIPISRRNLLLRHRDEAIRARAAAIFGAEAASPRGEIVARYRTSLSGQGDAEAGFAVYRRECAACHRAAGEGHDVGPALTTIRHWAPDEILSHILDPNREVSPEWTDYIVVLSDGRVLTGLLASDTDAGLTLRRSQGVEETVPRSQIAEIAGTGKSLMPEGLEKNISVEEMNDLIVFLREGKQITTPSREAP